MNLFYTDRSIVDIDLAFEWYEKQRKGLGFDFLDCIETALKYIINYPEMCQIQYANFRACPIRRFPFSIYYSVEIDKIIVHSIFDNRRNPDKRPR